MQCGVLSAPTTPEETTETNKLIYVLTQERLATLLTSVEGKLKLDAIIVDEAHEIGESNRGQTLERVLAVSLSRFPSARLFYHAGGEAYTAPGKRQHARKLGIPRQEVHMTLPAHFGPKNNGCD